MQQYCNTCGAPITAGMAACSRCGTPVASGGSGAYDPTVRAGSPPGTGYGQQPYGPPPSDPYGAPPPPPPGYGSQPQPGGFGAPPPPPGFGAQPAGFGAPQPGFGGPPPFAPPPKKSKTWIYVVGGILAVVIILCVVGIFALRALGNAVTNGVNNLATQVATITVTTGDNFTQTHTTGTHITQIQTGTGFDTTTGAVEGETATFKVGQKLWVVYTVANPDPGAVVLVKLLDDSGNLIDSGNSADLDTETNQYANSITMQEAGVYNVEIDYNGTAEATINFQITD